MNLTRRDLIKFGLAAAAVPSLPFRLSVATPAEDHFLFMLFLDGGADFSYLFDARPLEMTQNQLISNRIGLEPQLWLGANGGRTWASAITSPLLPFKNDFSIINGVFMDKTFDGHPNMVDLIFSGNPLGGDSFLPLINTQSGLYPSRPLNGIKKNTAFFTVDSHHSSLVRFDSSDITELVSHLKKQPLLSKSDEAWNFALSRMKAGGLLDPNGKWSQGSQQLFEQSAKAQLLTHNLGSLDISGLSTDVDLNYLDLYGRLIQKNMISAGLEVTTQVDPTTFQLDRFPFDSHGIASSESHVDLYKDVINKIAKTLEYFKTTAYDSTRSLLDVTTFVVATEFGRTMRQTYAPFEETGTDHNTLCNSFLFAGKGVRGGQVIGASDFQTSKETLSPVHLSLDKDMLKIMAKPFDFASEKPLDGLTEVFNDEHYITSANVMNTLFDIFSMPKDLYRRKNVGALPYPSLRSLLK